MKLFITKNPKSKGSFSNCPLAILKDRATDQQVAIVWTVERLSFNRFGGTNHWECNYIQLCDGYDLVTNEDDTIRLWNKGPAKQKLLAPKYNGVQEEAYIIDSNNQYVDFYAVKAPHFYYWVALDRGLKGAGDLFYQQWGKEMVPMTLKAKLEGTHLPTEGEVIVYSRRDDEIVIAFWDEDDHVMEYFHYKDGQSKRIHFSSLYATFTDEHALWEAVDEELAPKEQEEAPAEDCEEPRPLRRRPRRQA